MEIMRDNATCASNLNIVRINSDNLLTEIMQPGWIQSQMGVISGLNGGDFTFSKDDVLAILYAGMTRQLAGGQYFYFSADMTTLLPFPILYSYEIGIVAHAGGGQTNATQLQIGINTVATASADNDSVKLPDDALGQTVIITNKTAFTLRVFPFPGDSINEFAINTALILTTGQARVLIGTGVGNWRTFL